MTARDPARAKIDFADIQGLARFGHGGLKDAEFLLLDIADADAACAWLRAAPVTTAEWCDPPPDHALQLAFGAGGLRTLGVAPEIIGQFSEPFLAGIAGDESRSRRLGDIGANDPAGWDWGRPAPEMLVMLYARPGGLEAFKAQILTPAFERAFRIIRSLPTTTFRGREPFGFVDGISNPEIDWEQTFPTDPHERAGYANLLAPGELLLGHRNEYGGFTPRPLADPEAPGAQGLPEAEDAPDRRDLGRNGTYLAFRHLQQDVRGFWRFLDRAADGETARREALAVAMIGRHLDGAPLMPEGADIPGSGKGSDFLYDDDPDGLACPIGAHLRRANPRTGDLPPGVSGLWQRLLSRLGFLRRPDGLPGRHDLVASTRFHRIIRRGREYGTVLPPEEALTPEPDDALAGGPSATVPGDERGIHFICLGASLTRQFEFVQNAWLASPKFDGLFAEPDPLLGNREPLEGGLGTDGFAIPQASGVTERLGGMPRFVTVRGGAYFFMPGIRALRFIAGPAPNPGDQGGRDA